MEEELAEEELAEEELAEEELDETEPEVFWAAGVITTVDDGVEGRLHIPFW